MRAIVAADRFYFVLMYASFAFMVAWLGSHFGGLGFLRSHLPPESFTWNGGRPAQAVLVWYVIALATLVEPSFYEACFSAKNQRTARLGILVSIGFWVLFDFMTTATGLYARALLPSLEEPSRAFPLLAEQVLPTVARGLFFAGMLAVIMSTVDSYLFIAAQTLGRDIAWRWWMGRRRAGVTESSPAAGAAGELTWIRVALCIIIPSAIALGLSGLSAIEIWHHLGSIGTPALVVPMLASFDARSRLSPRAVTISILASAAVAAAWIVGGRGGDSYWLGLEPIFPALAVSIIVWLADTRLGRRRPGARSDPD
jgi:solute:Na+ symporter, SSS family